MPLHCRRIPIRKNEYVETEVSGYHPGSFWYFFQFGFYLTVDMQTLNQFQKQMIQVEMDLYKRRNREYEIKEFDDLMHEVEQMKEQIRNLIDDVVEKEKSIQRTEYEKLLYQINPHFLLNTLNSVQWMARMSRQDNITEFVQRLKSCCRIILEKKECRQHFGQKSIL